nr:hypothetical protein [Tanacetum cinerariifolium]
LRLCHRLIACSIAGRIQAPKKVTVTDLFYLRGIDFGSVNVPYFLARYLRLFVAGRKNRAHISGGQFVARLAEHFGLLTAEILGGLTVTAPELLIINMTELCLRVTIPVTLPQNQLTSHMALQYKIKGLPPWQSHKVSLAKEDKDQGLMVEIKGIGHQANPTAMTKDFGTHSYRKHILSLKKHSPRP